MNRKKNSFSIKSIRLQLVNNKIRKYCKTVTCGFIFKNFIIKRNMFTCEHVDHYHVWIYVNLFYSHLMFRFNRHYKSFPLIKYTNSFIYCSHSARIVSFTCIMLSNVCFRNLSPI